MKCQRGLPERSVLEILHEGEGLLAVRKPAGLVCHPTKGDARSSLIGRLRQYCHPGRVHLVNRLDRETSGVILAVRDVDVAGELGRLFETRNVRKEYLAIVCGHPDRDAFVVEAALGRDEFSGVAIKDCVRPDGVPAVTRVEVVRRFWRREGAFALVRVEPWTGRKHQIRIHLAHVGHPVLGDKIYGGDPGRYLRFVVGAGTEEDRAALVLRCQALHAAVLAFVWRGREWEFRAAPEPEFEAFLAGEPIGRSDEYAADAQKR